MVRLASLLLAAAGCADRSEPHFFAAEGGRARRFTPEALGLLQQHRWRGNIRELKNTIERVLIMARGDVIDAGDVRQFLRVEGAINNGPVVGTVPATLPPPAPPLGPAPVADVGAGAPSFPLVPPPPTAVAPAAQKMAVRLA